MREQSVRLFLPARWFDGPTSLKLNYFSWKIANAFLPSFFLMFSREETNRSEWYINCAWIVLSSSPMIKSSCLQFNAMRCYGVQLVWWERGRASLNGTARQYQEETWSLEWDFKKRFDATNAIFNEMRLKSILSHNKLNLKRGKMFLCGCIKIFNSAKVTCLEMLLSLRKFGDKISCKSSKELASEGYQGNIF